MSGVGVLIMIYVKMVKCTTFDDIFITSRIIRHSLPALR